MWEDEAMGDGQRKPPSSVSKVEKSTAPQALGKQARDAMIRLRANGRVGSQKKLHRELSEAMEAAHASGAGLSDMENRSFPHMWEELVARAPDLAEKWAVAGRVRWQDTGLGHALLKKTASESGAPWEGLNGWLMGHAHMENAESVSWMKMSEGDQLLYSAKKWMDWAPRIEECKLASFVAVQKVVESALPIVRLDIWGDDRPKRLNALSRLLLSDAKAQEATAPMISEQVQMNRARSRLDKWSRVMKEALEGGDVGIVSHVVAGIERDDSEWARRRVDRDAYRQMRTWFEVAIERGKWDCALWLMDQGGHAATLEAMDAQESFVKEIHAALGKGCRLNPGGAAQAVARRMIVERAKWLEIKGMDREDAAKRVEGEAGFAGGRLRASKSRSAFEQFSISVALELRSWVGGDSAMDKKVERNSPRL